REARGATHRDESLRLVLVGALGPDRLAVRERHTEIRPGDRHDLVAATHEMRFDARGSRVPARYVVERVELEVAAELAIDAVEEVLVDSGGDADRVAVCAQ